MATAWPVDFSQAAEVSLLLAGSGFLGCCGVDACVNVIANIGSSWQCAAPSRQNPIGWRQVLRLVSVDMSGQHGRVSATAYSARAFMQAASGSRAAAAAAAASLM